MFLLFISTVLAAEPETKFILDSPAPLEAPPVSKEETVKFIKDFALPKYSRNPSWRKDFDLKECKILMTEYHFNSNGYPDWRTEYSVDLKTTPLSSIVVSDYDSANSTMRYVVGFKNTVCIQHDYQLTKNGWIEVVNSAVPICPYLIPSNMEAERLRRAVVHWTSLCGETILPF